MTFESVLLWVLGYAGIAGAIVVIGGSACRLIAMQPGKTTKWAWGLFYGSVCFAGWWALALCLLGRASAFEQFVTVCAGMAIYLTVPSWARGVPPIILLQTARFRQGDTEAQRREFLDRRLP